IGTLELALEEPVSPAVRDHLEIAHSSARSLLAILHDVLDFSKIEAGRLDIVPVDVEIRNLVSEVHRLMSPVARTKGLRFESEVAESVPRFIRLDPVRVRQVLLNLTGNAVKFTDRGTVRVTAAPGDLPFTLHFRVADTGIGIPEGKQSLIFEPF